MTGAQFKAWLNSDWGPDAMWEEEDYTVNGAEVLEDEQYDTDKIADTDVVVLKSGIIFTDQNDIQHCPTISAVTHAKSWLKAQSTVTLMVDVPREHVEFFNEQFGGMSFNGKQAKVVGRIG
jgi:hypothetical protein